jgi:hypothetical protein
VRTRAYGESIPHMAEFSRQMTSWCVRTWFLRRYVFFAWANDALFLWRKHSAVVEKFVLNVRLFEGTDFKG